jgi:hypothetical protein
LLSFLHLLLVLLLEALALLLLLLLYLLLFLLMLPLELHITGVLQRPIGTVRVSIAQPVFVWITGRLRPVWLCRGRPVFADALILLRLRRLLSRLAWRRLRTARRRVRLSGLTWLGAGDAFNGYGPCCRPNDSHRSRGLCALGLQALHFLASQRPPTIGPDGLLLPGKSDRRRRRRSPGNDCASLDSGWRFDSSCWACAQQAPRLGHDTWVGGNLRLRDLPFVHFDDVSVNGLSGGERCL